MFSISNFSANKQIYQANKLLYDSVVYIKTKLNKRGLSCAKLSQQSASFLGPIELFFWFLLIVELINDLIFEFLNCWLVKLLNC